MLPGLIIIGSMKGGTSSLFRYLNSHPEMVGSRIKETDYFLGRKEFFRGQAWYEGLFEGEGSIAFEASPNYTKRHLSDDVPGRIHNLVPDVKLIYLLRDPIGRTLSHYVHNYVKGVETRTFSEAVKDPENPFIPTSRYFFQAEVYLDRFGAGRLLFLQSERLRKDRRTVMEEVAQFLGIDFTFDESVLNRDYHVTKGKKRSSRLEHHLRPYFKKRYIYRPFIAAMSPFRKPFEVPEISEADRQYLRDQLGPDVERLREFTGLEFPGWQI